MEQNMAILMADLSGYSALTETHGAAGAANVIDQYLDIVNDSLVGDTHLYEHTGDEVMIVSSSAEHLLSSAQKLLATTSAKKNFLQVHGGLHYGSILKHKNKLFGNTINMAARIAANANPGTIWCSEDYIAALQQQERSRFRAKGKHRFKNISTAKEVFEMVSEQAQDFWICPICKMQVSERMEAIPHPTEKEVFFCNPSCLGIYQQNNVN